MALCPAELARGQICPPIKRVVIRAFARVQGGSRAYGGAKVFHISLGPTHISASCISARHLVAPVSKELAQQRLRAGQVARVPEQIRQVVRVCVGVRVVVAESGAAPLQRLG